YLELRVAHPIDPLVEEPVQILSSSFFNRRVEIGSFNVSPLISLHVMIDGFPEQLFAQHKSQHIQNCAAPPIRIRIKKAVRILVTRGYYRPSISLIPRAKISLLISVHFV